MSKTSFVLRPVQDSELAEYDRIALTQGSLFYTLAWTNQFGRAITRYGIYETGGALRGGFALFEQKKLGLRILRDPPFSLDSGPFFESRAQRLVSRAEEYRDVMSAVAEFVDRRVASVVSISLTRRVADYLPFLWRGYKIVLRYTYVLDLARPIDEILAGMSRGKKNDVSRALRDGLEVGTSHDYDTVLKLAIGTFEKQRASVGVQILQRLLNQYANQNNSFASIVTRNGNPIACYFVVHDLDHCYCLLSGTSRTDAHSCGQTLAVVNVIRHAKDLGLKELDFMGSVIPKFEHFLMGFGGVLTPVCRVNKAWLPLEMALKLSKRELF